MLFNNLHAFFLSFVLFSMFFIRADEEILPIIVSVGESEVEIRKKFLKSCPNSIHEMVNCAGMVDGKILEGASGTYKKNEFRRAISKNKRNSVWSNKSSTVNINAGSTGNSLLDMLPPPARAIIIAIKLLKGFKQGGKIWFKKIFNICPPMTVEACLSIIKKDPYTEQIFTKIHNIHKYIEKINSSNIIVRIFARIKLIEIELPPPYDKKFKKAVEKLKKICTNDQGELIISKEIVQAQKIFKSYQNDMLIIPKKFIKLIPKLKKYKNYSPKASISSKLHNEILQLIKIEQNQPLSFPRLTRFCKSHGNFIIKELYKHFIEKRIKQSQQRIQQDPEWTANQENKSTEQQSKLLLRSYYQQELEEWVSYKEINDEEARDETYHALDDSLLADILPEGYHFWLLDNFIQNVCKGINNCSFEIIEIFFHPSGVLKKYQNNSFVEKYFLNKKILSAKLHKAINYALAIQGKIDTLIVKAACKEILQNSMLALRFTGIDSIQNFEENAYRLYREMVEKKGNVDPILLMQITKKRKQTECCGEVSNQKG